MAQGNGLHGKAAVVVDHLLPRGGDGMELHRELEPRAELPQHRVEHGPQGGRAVDVERGRAPQHAEGGDEAGQPEAVVAVQMGNEDGLYFGEAHVRPPQLHLRALTAIDHEELAAQLHHLGGGVVLQRGQRTAAAQNMYFEWFHKP